MGGVLELGELYPCPRPPIQVLGGHQCGQHRCGRLICDITDPKQLRQSFDAWFHGPHSRHSMGTEVWTRDTTTLTCVLN